MAKLQVALDIVELERALKIAEESIKGGADIIEAGTPLIKSEGMDAVRALREKFPKVPIVADMKTSDTGALEVEMAAKAGANIVNVLGNADDATIEDALRGAELYGVEIMADLMICDNPAKRAKELEELGVHYINVHVGIDQQMRGMSPLDFLSEVIRSVNIPVAVAGGLNEETVGGVVEAGAEIVIVGSAIIKSPDVTGATERIKRAMEERRSVKREEKNLEEEIRELFMSVSTPNISDALYRKGAMSGIYPIVEGVKMVGKAVTVQTFAGDWAKPVEAIDVAQKGDVIVIYNHGATDVAPWGELATHSCKNKGISGVVIDGAVRDVDEIKKMRFPVFAKAVVPNAGEPKGFGEINVEIKCGNQIVRPGDWIIGDDSGVVVVPKERAYEVAKRALEIKKHEDRVREEIRRGKTLAEVVELYKWEKK
ncbi:MAG: bifunctional hexulose-6-phosphate synthase/ribonuclease regulator [Archaeoglobi archaeon]|nr:bifunctional hexulose-6-phosphate synthase/ribonuclease regulator [Candidatus Mnemosynella bozhongmuii]